MLEFLFMIIILFVRRVGILLDVFFSCQVRRVCPEERVGA